MQGVMIAVAALLTSTMAQHGVVLVPTPMLNDDDPSVTSIATSLLKRPPEGTQQIDGSQASVEDITIASVSEVTMSSTDRPSDDEIVVISSPEDKEGVPLSSTAPPSTAIRAFLTTTSPIPIHGLFPTDTLSRASATTEVVTVGQEAPPLELSRDVSSAEYKTALIPGPQLSHSPQPTAGVSAELGTETSTPPSQTSATATTASELESVQEHEESPVLKHHSDALSELSLSSLSAGDAVPSTLTIMMSHVAEPTVISLEVPLMELTSSVKADSILRQGSETGSVLSDEMTALDRKPGTTTMLRWSTSSYPADPLKPIIILPPLSSSTINRITSEHTGTSRYPDSIGAKMVTSKAGDSYLEPTGEMPISKTSATRTSGVSSPQISMSSGTDSHPTQSAVSRKEALLDVTTTTLNDPNPPSVSPTHGLSQTAVHPVISLPAFVVNVGEETRSTFRTVSSQMGRATSANPSETSEDSETPMAHIVHSAQLLVDEMGSNSAEATASISAEVMLVGTITAIHIPSVAPDHRTTEPTSSESVATWISILTDPNPRPTSWAMSDDMPKALLPDEVAPRETKDMTLIRVGFLGPLNYNFIANNTSAATQIFTLLPDVLAVTDDRTATRAKVLDLRPRGTEEALGYLGTFARLYYPDKALDELRLRIGTPTSELYARKNQTLRQLAALIDGGFGAQVDDRGLCDTCDSVHTREDRRQLSKVEKAVIATSSVGGCLVLCGAIIVLLRGYRCQGRNRERRKRLPQSQVSQPISRPIESWNTLGW